MDPLKVLLLNAAGVSVVVKLVIDLAKATVGLTGRATQLCAVALAVALACIGSLAYGARPVDGLEAVWIGVQAAAMSIGLDQLIKRKV